MKFINKKDKLSILFYIFLINTIIFLFYAFLAAPFGGIVSGSCQWDCNWYLSIINGGYYERNHYDPGGSANWAFFPLFPYVTLLFAKILNIRLLVSSLILNNVLFSLTIFMSIFYMKERYDLKNKILPVLVFSYMPYSFYFRVPYSESIYAFLMISIMFLVYKKKYLYAGLCGILFTAARPTSSVVVASIAAVEFCYLCIERRQTGHIDRKALAGISIFSVISSIGLFAYMYYLHVHVGDALAFKHVESAWGRHFANPVSRVWHGLKMHDFKAFHFMPDHSPSQTYLAGAAVIAALLIIWGYGHKYWTEASISLVTLYLASSTLLDSIPRYMFANPAMLCIVCLLLDRQPDSVKYPIIASFGMIQSVLVILWYNKAHFLT